MCVAALLTRRPAWRTLQALIWSWYCCHGAEGVTLVQLLPSERQVNYNDSCIACVWACNWRALTSAGRMPAHHTVQHLQWCLGCTACRHCIWTVYGTVAHGL